MKMKQTLEDNRHIAHINIPLFGLIQQKPPNILFKLKPTKRHVGLALTGPSRSGKVILYGSMDEK